MARKRPRTRRGLPAAVGLGLAGGMRTFIPPAAIALRDRRPKSRLLRLTIVLASAGELAADKHPSTPSRTEPVGLGGRFAASGAVGWVCAGPIGGLLAGGAALGSAFAMHSLRGGLADSTGLPDPVLGAVEDTLALAIARFVTLKPLDARTPAVAPQPAPQKPAVGLRPADSASMQAKGRKAVKAAKVAKAGATRAAHKRARRPRRGPCRSCRRSRR